MYMFARKDGKRFFAKINIQRGFFFDTNKVAEKNAPKAEPTMNLRMPVLRDVLLKLWKLFVSRNF